MSPHFAVSDAFAMRVLASCWGFVFFAGSSSLFAADDGALRRCRALSDGPARLACYDAIPLGAPAQPSGAPTGAARPPAAAAPPRPAPAERFGFEQRLTPQEELATIQSQVSGRFEGWRPGTQIRLANGQVWQVTDDTSRFLQLDNPRVVVRRGALGSFWMDIGEDSRDSVRVRRVR